MKPIISFLLSTAVISCTTKTQPSSDVGINAEPVPIEQSGARTIPGDPSFVEAAEIVSDKGPQGITRNLLQDRNGNIWFASWQGIIQYDGSVFTNMTLKEGLEGYHVFSVLEDKNGNIWFGTIGGGVYCYNGKSFSRYTTENGLTNNIILSLAEDRSGNIWIGTQEGVNRYNGRTFSNFNEQDGLSLGCVNSIIQDKTGTMWLGTVAGIVLYDGRFFTAFKNKEGVGFANVRTLKEDSSGNIWIGSQHGLYRYDALSVASVEGRKLTAVTTNFTADILEDHNGMMWLSESHAGSNLMSLSRYDGVSFTQIAESNMISGIIEDQEGNIWFGGDNKVGFWDGKEVIEK